MNKKNIVLIWCLAILLFVAGFVVYNSNKAPDSAAYRLISSILQDLNMNDINIEKNSIKWNLGRYQTLEGKMMSIYRPGYSFQIVGEVGIGSSFTAELIKRGFTQDWNNSGDATISSTQGYIDGPIGCTIRASIVIDDIKDFYEQVKYPVDTTVSCADNVLWEGATTPASTTDLSTFQG